MTLLPNPYRTPPALRRAIVASFAQTPAEMRESLSRFRERDWSSQLTWLDVSGLALYLLGRLTDAGLQHLLPVVVLERLQRNAIDNRARNLALLHEAAKINLELQREGVLYANLKGISLTPESVPDPALRCQLDLDFMVHAEHMEKAAHILEHMGYALDAVSGDTWEFKAGHAGVASLRDLYKSKPQRAAELHATDECTLLNRLHIRTYDRTTFPVLCPEDLYVAQALHLHKHLCSDFTRAAWLLEHRAHMLTRRDDELFWQRLHALVEHDPKALHALGVATLLVVQSFGDVPPPMLAALIEEAVSPAVKVWIVRYGQASLLADFPGTKLYLLLKESLEPEADTTTRERRARLLPRRAPRMIAHGYADESLPARLRRYRAQLAYVLFRLRFHCVEGLRYLVEATRFRRILMERSH